MNKDLIDRVRLLDASWETTDIDGSSISVVSLEDIKAAPSYGLVPDGFSPIILANHEIEKIMEALDVMGDRIADREGYSSGEVYWDLKEKLLPFKTSGEKAKTLDSIISAAQSRSNPASHDKINYQKEPEI